MRASSRFAMAVHVLAVLAYKEGDRVTSQLLAGSINTNSVIVRRLLLDLQKAKLIDTLKGAGSRLDRSPHRITLAEVYRAVEENEPFVFPSGKPNEACPVGQWVQDELQTIFKSAEAALEKDLARTTLADVVESIRKKCESKNSRG